MTKNILQMIHEKEIGNLSENEFRVMIGKMFQNLENRMEKMQETFNKDLKEQKSKQTVTNNTTNEIKNTLGGISPRITDQEEPISELEDRRMEITANEQNREKKEGKELRRVSETSGTILNAPTFGFYGSQKEKNKRKSLRKFLKRL